MREKLIAALVNLRSYFYGRKKLLYCLFVLNIILVYGLEFLRNQIFKERIFQITLPLNLFIIFLEFAFIFSIYLLLIFILTIDNGDNGDGGDGGWDGKEGPKDPRPDPSSTKNLIEKVIRESREKSRKNPALL